MCVYLGRIKAIMLSTVCPLTESLAFPWNFTLTCKRPAYILYLLSGDVFQATF